MNKEEQQGYNDAIQALKDMIAGKTGNGSGMSMPLNGSGSGSGSSSSGSGGGSGSGSGTGGNSGMNAPELNKEDAKKAEKNAKANASDHNQASKGVRDDAAKACNSVGGVLSQEDGAAIAKSEGYDDKDCKVENSQTLADQWKEATIEACSKNNSPGSGNIVSHFKDYYITSHNWKEELKKYIGRALSSIEDETRLGKKKWLAQGEIKKYDVPSENLLDSVVFLIDCSGSVSDKLLQNIISECYTICVKKKIKKVTYCYYDDGIRQMETNDTMKSDGILNPDMVSKIKRGNAKPIADIHGRGGNEEDQVMKQLSEMIKKSHKHPELVMWFTDGYTYARPVRPKQLIKHMIWVIYDNNDFKANDDSRVIHIKSSDLGNK